jgi:DNA-binding GntR family transcriptional regulator
MTPTPAFSRGELPDHALPGKRLSDQVASFLRSRIYSGEYQPGQRLLELDLCRELGISRTPLREAFLNLQREGLIDVRPRRGATVATFTLNDLHENTELRAILEGLAARRVAEAPDSAAIRRMLHAVAEMRHAAELGDGVAAAVAHIEFHRSIARASGFPRLVAFVDQLIVQSVPLHGYADLAPDELLELAASHTPLVTLVESGDPDAAERALNEHIRGLSAPIRKYLEHEIGAETGAAGGRADFDSTGVER